MEIQPNASLKEHNSLALTCEARHLITARDEKQIVEALQFARQRETRPLVIGEGSNIVFAKDRLETVIKVVLAGKTVVREDSDFYYLRVAAGENWNDLVNYCVARGYYGLENLALIPGSVGAAPVQNIGAYGVELDEFFEELTYVDCATLKTKFMRAQDCQFAYRDSIFKHELRDKAIISSVTLRLRKAERLNVNYAGIKDELRTANQPASACQLRDAVVRIRRRKLPDPQKLPNAGSFFKNPLVNEQKIVELQQQFVGLVSYPTRDSTQVKLAAAWLIDQAGWKAYRKGNVGVHKNQPLVLINYGHSTGKELLALAADIEHSVREKFGVVLEIEPRVFR